MIWRVGNADSIGKEYVAHLREEEKVLVDTVDEVDGVNTGIAHITVSSSGENSIVIVQGANGALNAPFLDEHYEYLQLGKVLLCQNEIPFASTIAGLHGEKISDEANERDWDWVRMLCQSLLFFEKQ